MIYIGDISKQDAKLLADHAFYADRILEFGVGASTQVLRANSRGEMISVETSPEWIEKTKENFKLLGINKTVDFRDYYTFKPDGVYDLIFDDGATEFRLPFAQLVWENLAIGGYFLLHDTRTDREVKVVSELVKLYSPEIEIIFMNKDHSNITVIKKKDSEFYSNWNLDENKPPYMSGYENPTAEEIEIIKELVKAEQ